MSVNELSPWLNRHKDELIESLSYGNYEPEAIRGVQIPKPGDGMRQSGIPTVKDRLVQQAILQIIEPIFGSTFSESNYRFRPGRGAHQAILKAREYVSDCNGIIIKQNLIRFAKCGR
jgi:RNA-directed DNA polymerase